MLLPHSAGSGGARQFLPNTFPCQLRIGVCDFDAGGGIALLHSRQHRGTAAGKGVQNMPARFRNLHNVPHQLQRLLRQMDAALGIAVFEHPRQTRDRTADGHIAVGAPDDILRLLTEAPLLRAAVALIPNCGAAPDPTGPLESVCRRGKLPPVDEHTYRRTALAYLSRFIQPLRRPAGPGALDLKLRQEMQRELKKIQQKLGITFIFVTHDQEEALTMSDTIVVMNKGKIQQMGSPEDIYNEPKNSFVAKFIGESNIVDGVMLDDYRVKFCGREFECVDYGFEKNENIEVVIRPEDIKMVDADKGMLKGLVTSVVFKGVHYEMAVQENENTWFIHSTKMAEEGSMLGMDIYPEDIHIMRKVSDQ